MAVSPDRFPYLNHFLNAYMHQDWTLAGADLPDVLRLYVKETSPEDVEALRADIDAFIAQAGDRLESDYYTLFPNSVLPSAWGMSVERWLHHVADLAGGILPERGHSA